MKKTATLDHTVKGRDGHVAREGAAGEQHKCVHGGGGRGADHSGTKGDGQAHP